jgi:hypothetical protein
MFIIACPRQSPVDGHQLASVLAAAIRVASPILVAVADSEILGPPYPVLHTSGAEVVYLSPRPLIVLVDQATRVVWGDYYLLPRSVELDQFSACESPVAALPLAQALVRCEDESDIRCYSLDERIANELLRSIPCSTLTTAPLEGGQFRW